MHPCGRASRAPRTAAKREWCSALTACGLTHPPQQRAQGETSHPTLPLPLPSWVVLGLDATDRKTVQVVASGRCGLDKIRVHLSPEAILFVGFRAYAVEAAIKQPRFVSFVWTGKAAPLKMKVALSNLKSSVMKYFEVRRGVWEGVGAGVHVRALHPAPPPQRPPPHPFSGLAH